MKIEKVLVVDDSKVAHLTLRKMLTERGIEVDWVGSGEDSIVYLKEKHPDVVFMDVMMPGMDGFETTTAINTDSGINAPPIIMCSANTTDEDKENAERLGAIDFLSKPYTTEELDSVLNKVSSHTVSNVESAAQTVPSSNDSVIHHAEQAAWATADKVSREVASSEARTIVESAAREATEVATRKAAQVATQAARNIVEKSIQAALDEFKRDVNGTIGAQIKSAVTEQLSLQPQATGPDPNKLRSEIQRSVEQQLTQQVTKTVESALAGDQVNQQLRKLVQQSLPKLEDSARNAAIQVTDELAHSLAEENRGSGKGLAITALILALAALGGVGAIIAGLI